MAVEGQYELDFNLKSEDNLKIVLEKLNDFFTYNYIGENCYKIDKLNIKMDVSYYRGEEECNFDIYFVNSIMRKFYDADSGYEMLCSILIEDIQSCKNHIHHFSESIFSDNLSIIFEKDINRFKKYLLMMDILDMLDTFSIKFWDICADENGEIIKNKREYLNIITEKNYK